MTLVTVLSASGRPGLAQVRQLLKAGYSVRATTRNPERMSKFDGVEVVSADYNDPDSIYEACVGADTVFYTRPSFEESHKALDFAATVGSAAKRANVRAENEQKNYPVRRDHSTSKPRSGRPSKEIR